jgi:hypothetical protein
MIALFVFALRASTAAPVARKASVASRRGSSSGAVSLLDGKRSQNAAIALARIKVSFSDVRKM